MAFVAEKLFQGASRRARIGLYRPTVLDPPVKCVQVLHSLADSSRRRDVPSDQRHQRRALPHAGLLLLLLSLRSHVLRGDQTPVPGVEGR